MNTNKDEDTTLEDEIQQTCFLHSKHISGVRGWEVRHFSRRQQSFIQLWNQTNSRDMSTTPSRSRLLLFYIF